MDLNAIRDLIEAAELADWYNTENAKVLTAAQDAYAAMVGGDVDHPVPMLNPQGQNVYLADTITPLDLAWEQINALGGYVEPGDKVGEAENRTLADALKVIEGLGGRDPGFKRARLAAIDAELQGIADDIAALTEEKCGHG